MLLLLLLSAAAWTGVFWHRGSTVLAAAGILVPVGLPALVIGLECLIAWWVQGRRIESGHAQDWWRAWAGEVCASISVFGWQQPFRALAHPDRLQATSGGRDDSTRPRGVLLVHGFACNRALWNHWMPRLADAGIPYLAIDLEPPFGTIDAYVPHIEKAVARIEAATGRRPVIVAHSMGGLAVRRWMQLERGSSVEPLRPRVHRVITIGTPHRGTWLARWAYTLNGRQMQLNSRWIDAMSADGQIEPRPPFTCFYSACDNIVFPAMSATLPGADNRLLEGVAHLGMVHHDEVYSEVLRWTRMPDPVAPPSGLRTVPAQ